jgi:hypothetical protein
MGRIGAGRGVEHDGTCGSGHWSVCICYHFFIRTIWDAAQNSLIGWPPVCVACLLLVIHLFLCSSLLCPQVAESPLFYRGPPQWRDTYFFEAFPQLISWVEDHALNTSCLFMNFFPWNLADRECTLNTLCAYIHISCSRYVCGPDLDQHPFAPSLCSDVDTLTSIAGGTV